MFSAEQTRLEGVRPCGHDGKGDLETVCEFCVRHGEGEKWYLRAKNYADDLLSDLRRRRSIEEFLSKPERLTAALGKLEELDRAPGFVRRAVAWYASRQSKKRHFGQVVPIEDVERIFGFVNSVVRIACICRWATRGVEGRYCYAVSLAPDGGRLMEIMKEVDASFLNGPDVAGMEKLPKSDALERMREHEREGLCHTVWTFKTPFIGGICNCDRADCLAMRATLGHALPVMFRAEYVAVIDPERCVGCRACMRVCQFGALGTSAAREKAEIDPRKCYGCGICRSVCEHSAIRLSDRRDVPLAKNRW